MRSVWPDTVRSDVSMATGGRQVGIGAPDKWKGDNGCGWRRNEEDNAGNTMLTSVVVECARLVGGEERTDGASRAHGGGGAPAMLRRRRGEHRVGDDVAKPNPGSAVAKWLGRHRRRRTKKLRLPTEKLQIPVIGGMRGEVGDGNEMVMRTRTRCSLL